MQIELIHASKYGNGEKVVSYLQGSLVARGHQANVHHVKEIKPKEVPTADLYVFCSPTRMGRPIGSMRGFIKKLHMLEGARYAIIATYARPKPNKKTGEMPTDEQVGKFQRTLSTMDEMLAGKGATKTAELKIFVLDIKGPLEEDWDKKMEAFGARLG